MKRILKAALLCSILSLGLAACSGGKPEEKTEKSETTATKTTQAAEKSKDTQEEKALVVYTARSEALNNAVIPEFESATGIKVEVVVAGTGELLKRAQSEKENPLGDIFWAADQTMLSSSKDLFEKYVSPENDNMIEPARNTTGYFTPAFADPTVMIVNKDLAGDIKIEGFADLLNPKLKGKIAFGDPVNSSSAFQ